MNRKLFRQLTVIVRAQCNGGDINGAARHATEYGMPVEAIKSIEICDSFSMPIDFSVYSPPKGHTHPEPGYWLRIDPALYLP